MYELYVVFKCKDGAREKFVERVKAEGILDAILNEKGCKMYQYFYSDNDKNLLLLLETWDSKSDQQVHLTQPHMDKLRAIKGDYILSTTVSENKPQL